MMKAINILENKDLEWSESILPSLADNEVLIKIVATSVNRADVVQKNGLYPPPPGASNILGLECSGIIERIGKNVKNRKVGEEVCALLAGGGYAEYVSCPEVQVIPIPEGINLIEASSLPEAYATCWLNLFLEANLSKDEKVLLHAGASGIGTAAIQLCKVFECETFVTAGSIEKVKFCTELGASDGALRTEEPFKKIKEWSPDGVDIILDPVGGNYFEDNINVLSVDGRLVIIGIMGGAKSSINLGSVLMKRQKIIGSTIRARSSSIKGKIMNNLHEHVWPFFRTKEIKTCVHEILSIKDASKAHEIMENNQNIGKIILEIN